MTARGILLLWFGLLWCTLPAAPARADGIPRPERHRPPGIHARELHHWNRQPPRDWKTFGPRISRSWPQRDRNATQTHHILGFHPYWMGTNYLAYDWSTLHTVVFFSLEIDSVGTISDTHGWPWTQLVQHAHDNGARVLVAATQFSSADLSTLLGSAANRSAAVANLVNAMVQGGADGLCLDFEAIPGTRKQHFVDFADELRTAMDITLPQSMLVITTPAVDWNNAYDYDELAARSDHLLLMAYDYHWSGSSSSGPVAPLTGWGTWNVTWSVQDHLLWGAPADKLLLGVPYYGYRWGTSTELAGASTTSSGTARTFSNVQPQIALQEELWDAASATPWLRVQDPDWQQTWFDDATSLQAKYALVRSEGLAGVGIWALGYDDPYTELWNALHAAFDETTSDAMEAPRAVASLRVLDANPFGKSVQLAVDLPDTGTRPATAFVPPEETRLHVFDVRGRRIRTLSATRSSSRRLTFVWDGRTGRGAAAPPGVYLAVWRPGVDRAGAPRSVRLVKRP